jgi:site-specific recombinase XerD
LSALRSFLAFLKEDELEIHASLEKIQRLKQAERLPRYLSAEQVGRLKEVIEAGANNTSTKVENYDALLTRTVFYLLWQGGLRVGEVEELRLSDFYISADNCAKRLFVRDSKWRKGRAVYLTDVSLEALQAYLKARGVEKAGGYVFIRNGLPFKKELFVHNSKEDWKAIGCRGISSSSQAYLCNSVVEWWLCHHFYPKTARTYKFEHDYDLCTSI